MTCVCVKSARGIAPRTASLLFCQLCNAESSSPLHFYPVFFLRSRSLDKLRIIPERACLHCVFRRLSGLANQNRLGFRCHAGFCESKNCRRFLPGDRTHQLSVFRETVEIKKHPLQQSTHDHSTEARYWESQSQQLTVPRRLFEREKGPGETSAVLCVRADTTRARHTPKVRGRGGPHEHAWVRSGDSDGAHGIRERHPARCRRVRAATTTARETTLVRESAVAFPNIE